MILPRRLAISLAMVTLTAVAGCGPHLHNGPDEQTAEVVFVNQSLDQADVYVVTESGHSQRIGTVFAGRTETLTIPNNVLARAGTVSIAARLLARSIAPTTGPLTLYAGERLQITLPPHERSLTVLPAP